ncbi:hypothetical protein OG264_08820 [Streptomyces xanthophaeus]|uniref:hypothetical protein n=1 Tax=Streptomyces xanthophaeus TaxID=67385 RepID=UPI00386E490B|nr:hypothetical protein OG264_08820 [Streptomyces xanthophaeus]WST63423.1 hypothetical protein OG605_29540 [Streptomyces xanthophaeus]
MGKLHEHIDGRLRTFIEEQPVFFTATAPLAGDGHVNLSPKGRAGTLVVIDEQTLAYLDFGGSGAELHAEYFARKSDEEFAGDCEKKVASSLDGLPALPVPLPPRTV